MTGFSDEPAEFHGTYAHCYSWFDVDVLTPSGRWRVPRRELQCNVHAESTPREHTIIWDIETTADAVLQGWLRSIRPADTIQVIPMARMPAWRNHIHEIEMQIHGVSSSNEHGVPSLAVRLLQAGSSKGRDHSSSIMCPLDNNLQEIRLLTLHSGVHSEPLSGNLTRISLLDQEQPTFDCLSYCWGDLRDTTTIDLLQGDSPNRIEKPDSFNCLITQNLASALRRLRDVDKPRVLWVDAVCINQDDPKERAEQIVMLREIYSRAENVVIWLGTSDEDTEEAIRASKSVMKFYSESVTTTDEQSRDRMFRSHDAILRGRDTYFVDSPILASEWFRRAWVLQEVHLARKAYVVCGSETLPWSLILRVNECLNLSMFHVNVPLQKSVLPRLFASLFKLHDNYKALGTSTAYISEPNKFKILDIFIQGLDLETSDPRDKLFALLSFGRDTSELASLPPEITPDYTKTKARVFADFTRWWIIRNRSLDILSAVHLSQGRTWLRITTSTASVEFRDRPSWCIWHDGRSVWLQGVLAFGPTHKWNASKGSVLDMSILTPPSNPLILNLRGRRIGMIKKIEHYPHINVHAHLQQADECSDCWHKHIQKVYELIFDPINQQGTWCSSVQRKTGATTRDDSASTIERGIGDHFLAHAADNKAGYYDCHDPCFFVTGEGNVGLCPYQARVHDQIVVLYGAKVPFVIRSLARTEDSSADDRPSGTASSGGSSCPAQYLLVGECYLDGFMHGHAMSEHSKNDPSQASFKEEIFELT